MVRLFLSLSYLNPTLGFSSFAICVRATKLVSRFISEEIVPYVAVDVVFLERKLIQEPPMLTLSQNPLVSSELFKR